MVLYVLALELPLPHLFPALYPPDRLVDISHAGLEMPSRKEGV